MAPVLITLCPGFGLMVDDDGVKSLYFITGNGELKVDIGFISDMMAVFQPSLAELAASGDVLNEWSGSVVEMHNKGELGKRTLELLLSGLSDKERATIYLNN